jgi:hypothetical protein
LSGTVAIEKSHAEWLEKEQRNLAELRKENERLAELESKIDAISQKYSSSSTHHPNTDKS